MMDALLRFWWKHQLRGRRTLYSIFKGSSRIAYPTKDGIWMKLAPSQYIDNIILHDGYYEPNVLEAILSSLRSGDTFWDIGSNLGLHALTVKKKMPSVQVVAFEPNPEMFGLIADASKRNGLDLIILKQGLSDRTGEVDFFINQENSGGGGVDEDPTRPEMKQIKVFFCPGDDLIKSGKATFPNVLKIDVEGHEHRVCLGLRQQLGNPALRTIIFEDRESAETPVKTLLFENGFRVSALPRSGEDPHNFIAERN